MYLDSLLLIFFLYVLGTIFLIGGYLYASTGFRNKYAFSKVKEHRFIDEFIAFKCKLGQRELLNMQRMSSFFYAPNHQLNGFFVELLVFSLSLLIFLFFDFKLYDNHGLCFKQLLLDNLLLASITFLSTFVLVSFYSINKERKDPLLEKGDYFVYNLYSTFFYFMYWSLIFILYQQISLDHQKVDALLLSLSNHYEAASLAIDVNDAYYYIESSYQKLYAVFHMVVGAMDTFFILSGLVLIIWMFIGSSLSEVFDKDALNIAAFFIVILFFASFVIPGIFYFMKYNDAFNAYILAYDTYLNLFSYYREAVTLDHVDLVDRVQTIYNDVMKRDGLFGYLQTLLVDGAGFVVVLGIMRFAYDAFLENKKPKSGAV